jgi:hypothetical protein
LQFANEEEKKKKGEKKSWLQLDPLDEEIRNKNRLAILHLQLLARPDLLRAIQQHIKDIRHVFVNASSSSM